jgi:predicted  nucleic acid-binding Zn-ribbon protein
MQVDLDRLFELQQVELRLLELTRQIRVFPTFRKEIEQKLENARQAVQQAKEARTENATERKKLELDVMQINEKMEKLRGQLFEVKTNEAYRAMQEEVAYLEKQKATAEDRELEALVDADKFEEGIKQAEAELKEADQKVNADLQRVTAEHKEREAEAAKLQVEQEKLRGAISAESLEQYDILAKGKGGQALAEVRDEICQACMTQVRPQIYVEVRRREKVHTCDSCHRILCYVETPTVDVEKEMAKDNQA